MARTDPRGKKLTARLYFAYGAALDRDERAAWKRSHPDFRLPAGQVAEATGVEIVFDAPSKRWTGRVAALHKKKGGAIFGELFEIAQADWPAIAAFEGAAGWAERVEVEVTVKAGAKKWVATAFTVAPKKSTLDGPVSESFLKAWAQGAAQAKLPKAYVEQLQAEALIVQRVQQAGRRLKLSGV